MCRLLDDLRRHVIQARIHREHSLGEGYRRADEAKRNGERLMNWYRKNGDVQARVEQLRAYNAKGEQC